MSDRLLDATLASGNGSAPDHDFGEAEVDTLRARRMTRPEPIKIGLIHALTGSFAIAERAIHQGALLAVEEVNSRGGIGGRPLQPIVEDYASDFALANLKAQKLVLEEEVAIVIGGYTSASRVAMIPVFEQSNAIFFYGTYYEGLECSPACFYGGAVPNQFLVDYVPWVMENLGTSFYIVGSDYIYPRTASAIIRNLLEPAGGTVVADEYFAFGTTDFGATIASIEAKQPDVLFSNMVGDSTIAFYKQFRNGGFTPDTLPIAATVTTEVEVQAMGAEFAQGNYMTATYFQSLDNPANQDFVAAYKKRWGEDGVTSMPLVGTYHGVHLFAEAARMLGGNVREPDALREALVGATFQQSPEGIPIKILPNHHCNHPSYVGQTNREGQFDIVATFSARDADPFPAEIVPPDRAPTVPTPVTQLQQ